MKRCATAVVLVSLALSGGRAQDAGVPKHLADARDLLKHLDLQHTSYAHGEPKLSWTGTREVHADCSGFLDELLVHTYGYDRTMFKKWFDSSRPSAARYHDAIIAGRGFAEVKRIADVLPGDVLSVKYFARKDNTGHVMLVAETPRAMQPKKPLIAGAAQWEVTVIDSSKTGHGPTDTRYAKGKDGKDHDGLGQGVLRIYVDKQGQVVGFTWSTLTASEFKDPKDEHLVIGRHQPNFKP